MRLDKDTLQNEVAGHQERMNDPLWSKDGEASEEDWTASRGNAPTPPASSAPDHTALLRSILTSRVYDVAHETPLDPAQVAEVLAGEQSSGTFVRVESSALPKSRVPTPAISCHWNTGPPGASLSIQR